MGCDYDPWIDLENTVRAQHEMQVDLFFPRHHQFMLDNGIDKRQKIVDLGTGDGAFLKKLAGFHPKIQFTGVECRSNLIDKARLDPAPNIQWVHADAFHETTQSLLRGADAAIMRYFILHLPNTKAALPVLLGGVRLGTRLWIFDIDIDKMRCKPSAPAFKDIKKLVQTFCNKNAVRIRTERELPAILEAAGFKIDDVSTMPFNNRTIDPKLFARYVLWEAILYQYHITGEVFSPMLREAGNFLNNVMTREKYFAQYDVTMISATKTAFNVNGQ